MNNIAARSGPPGRPLRQSLGHQTLALPNLRDRRENHHPRPAASSRSAPEKDLLLPVWL
jgi:hypothetical protein